MGGRPVGTKTERYRSRLVRGPDGIYSISVKVPAELKPRLQAEDIRLSLNTADLEEAACIQPFMAHDLSEALEKVAREICLEAFDAAEDFIQMDRIGGAYVEQSADVIIGKILAACASPKQIHYEAAYAPTTPAARGLLRAVDQLVSDFNIPVGRYSVNFWKLVGRIDRLRHGPLRIVSRLTTTDVARTTAQPHKDPSLLEAIAFFEHDIGKDWSIKRRLAYGQAFAILCEVVDRTRPMSSITRGDFRRVRDLLEELTPQWRRLVETRHLTIQTAADRSRALGLPKRSAVSMNRVTNMYKVFMDYAVAENWVTQNTAVFLLRRSTWNDAHRPGGPFELHHLNLIFHAGARFDPSFPKDARDGRFWILLLGLWTGMRLSECAQLHVKDIRIASGVPIIQIVPEKMLNRITDKSLKTKASVRVMPIHPALQKIGFLDYWESRRETGLVQLFPDLQRRNSGHTFSWLSAELSEFIRQAIGNQPGLTFRSFRHSFRDALRDADVPGDQSFMLGGWRNRRLSASDNYGIGGTIPRLYKCIEKVEYPGLDLSHLEIYKSAETAMKALQGTP